MYKYFLIRLILKVTTLFLITIFIYFAFASDTKTQIKTKKIAYLVSDIQIPFWNILAKGIQNNGTNLGYTIEIYSADNTKQKELINTIQAIEENVDGIIVSPINSSTCVTILKLAKKNDIPVVIADIGTDSGEYISYISSNNFDGGYQIGKILTKKMYELNFEDGSVGIVSIPQKRANGKARTKGFIKALNEAKIKGAGIRQQVNFSYLETYKHSINLIEENKDLKAIWLQGSDKYLGALNAIIDKNKFGDILLITFDAEPIFLELIPRDILVGAGMQQPFLMGEYAIKMLDKHLNGQFVEKNIELPILAISKENIKQKLPFIKRNVLGLSK